MPTAQYTPNVVVQNPVVRRVAGVVIGVAALVLPALKIVEVETSVDFSSWLPAATQIMLFLAGAFGLAVTVPNVPNAAKDEARADEATDLEAEDLYRQLIADGEGEEPVPDSVTDEELAGIVSDGLVADSLEDQLGRGRYADTE